MRDVNLPASGAARGEARDGVQRPRLLQAQWQRNGAGIRGISGSSFWRLAWWFLVSQVCLWDTRTSAAGPANTVPGEENHHCIERQRGHFMICRELIKHLPAPKVASLLCMLFLYGVLDTNWTYSSLDHWPSLGLRTRSCAGCAGCHTSKGRSRAEDKELGLGK